MLLRWGSGPASHNSKAPIAVEILLLGWGSRPIRTVEVEAAMAGLAEQVLSALEQL